MRQRPPKGIAMLLTVIVVGVTGFAVMAFIARSSIASLRSSQYQQASIVLQELVYGCIDEVVAQHVRSVDFNNAVVSLGPTSCSITVLSSSPTEKELELEVTDGISTASRKIIIGLDPVTLISVE